MSLLSRLEEHEGFRAHAYQDSLGFWTVGFGRCIDKRRCSGLTKEEARYLLLNDVRRVMDELDERLPWWSDLDEVRRDVLIEMGYQLGVRGLTGFKGTLRAVRAGRWDDASRGMLQSLWAKQTPKRASKLAELMRTGQA